jgi:hypothetical protein
MIKIDNMIDVAGHGRSSFVMLNELKGYMRGSNTLVDMMILSRQDGMVWVYPDVKISFESYKDSSTDLHCTCVRCYYRNENGNEIWREVDGSKVDIDLRSGFVNLTPVKSIEFKIRQHLEYFDHMMIKYPNNETTLSETPYIEAIIHDPNNKLTRRDLKDLYKGLGVVSIDNGIPVKTSYISVIGESDHPKADEFDGDTILVAGTSLDVLHSNASRKLIDITQMSGRQKLLIFKYIIDDIISCDPDDVAIWIAGFNKGLNLVNVMFTKVKVQRCNYELPAFNFHGMDVVNGEVSNHECDIVNGTFDGKVLLMTIKFDTPTCDIRWVFGSHKQTVEIIEKSEVGINESKDQEEANNT